MCSTIYSNKPKITKRAVTSQSAMVLKRVGTACSSVGQNVYARSMKSQKSSIDDYLEEMMFQKPTKVISESSIKTTNDCKDPNSFLTNYKAVCKSLNIQPLSRVKIRLSDLFIDFHGDNIKFMDLIALLKAISEDKCLHFIAIRSRKRGNVVQEHVNTAKKARSIERGSVLFTRYIINKISESLNQCLQMSRSLTCIHMQKIPLSGSPIIILSEGLSKTQSLQHLALQYCSIGDEGCLALSRALRNVTTLISLDLSYCSITDTGAKYISDLLKSQEIARFGEAWKRSLRYREVDHEEIQGLRRVTLNDNQDIEDLGLQHLADVLFDDYWLKALDLQNCGLSEVGGSIALKLVQINTELAVVDVRRNPHVSSSVITSIAQILNSNLTEEKAKHGWLNVNSESPKTISTSDSHITLNSICQPPWNRGPGRVRRDNSKHTVDPDYLESTQQALIKVKKWRESNIQVLEKDKPTKSYICPETTVKVSKSIQSLASEESINNNKETQMENTDDKENTKVYGKERPRESNSDLSSSDSIKPVTLDDVKKAKLDKDVLWETADIKTMFNDFMMKSTSSNKKRVVTPKSDKYLKLYQYSYLGEECDSNAESSSS